MLLSVLINRPRRDGMVSWHWYTVATREIWTCHSTTQLPVHQMPANETRHRHTAVSEISWSTVLKTTMECYGKLVLQPLRKSASVDHALATTDHAHTSDQPCCSIQSTTELVCDSLWCRIQNRVLNDSTSTVMNMC